MFEQTFKNIDDILYKDSGADSELDYIGQTSWVMFLRYLDELEQDKADEAALQGKEYYFIIDEEYRWPVWAMPKSDNGKLDIHKSMTGPDLVQFVDHKLFPYLAGFKLKADNPQTIEYKIGEIFSELKNKIQSGYNLREIIELADELPFRTSKDKHELSHLYESKIKNMGNAGRNGGQYYTPRPLIRAMIEVIQPKIGERIYDGACGSCGFLCETFEYLTKDRDKLSTTDLQTLQTKTFYGKEKKNLAYVIGIMNMILHGIEAPNIVHTNTLSENVRDIQDKDRYNVILTNPPFGGKERPEVQQNFDIRTGETAFLFLQHFIKNLKAGGKAAIVIKNTLLSNTDNASVSLRKYLIETCNLHTILDMPAGTFTGAGVKTVTLFFTKGEATKNIWYYQLVAGRSLGKTNALNDADMQEFISLQKTKPETLNSWNIKISDIQTHNYDLSVINPNTPKEAKLRSPHKILTKMDLLDVEVTGIQNNIKILLDKLNNIFENSVEEWEEKKLVEICESLFAGGDVPKNNLSKTKTEKYKYPIFSNGIKDKGLYGYTDLVRVDKPSITISARGTIGYSEIRVGGYFPVVRLIVVIPNEKIVKLPFLKYAISRTVFSNTGSSIPQLTVPMVEQYKIPLPPLSTQIEIVSQLDELTTATQKLENLAQQKQFEFEELKKSILEKAFSGQLKTYDVIV